MVDVRTTHEFDRWLMDLKDQRARNRIVRRIVLIRGGILGDHKSVGDGIGEFRIDEGPGYRLYFTRRCDNLDPAVRWRQDQPKA
jgi:putative addiction module killer protein